MSKPSSFVTTSDFPTLKNDASGDATITIPSGVVIAANGVATYSYDLNIGVQGAPCAGRISSSKDSNIWYRAQQVVYSRYGLVDGDPSPALYNVAAFFWRASPTVVRCQIEIPNGYGATFTCESGAETVSFHVNTFIPPFA